MHWVGLARPLSVTGAAINGKASSLTRSKKSRVLITAALVAIAIPSVAQLHVVEPDPNSGRPTLLSGLNGEMELPILIYSSTDVDLFITPSALNAVSPQPNRLQELKALAHAKLL